MRVPRLIASGLAALIAMTALASLALAQPSSRPLVLGFGDSSVFSLTGAAGAPWWERAVQSGATVVRLDASWATIAPTEPADPSNPADPAYQWSALDAQIRSAVSYGLTPIVTLTGAPAWATGSGAPSGSTPGTWRPNASAYGEFAAALGRRYSGSYPDPLAAGSDLPLVRYWEPWNEPNLSIYLAPQWTRQGRHWVAASPVIYRGLLNAFYAGLTSTLPQAQVIAAGTAPFGDPPGGERMAPVVFDRTLLCLTGAALKPAPCPNPAHFEILDHHPYAIGSPYTRALDPNDVSIPDIGKLSRLLVKAEETGRVLPSGAKPVWVLEVGYDTDPPNPQGVPVAEDALWTEETLYELWSEGVGTITWFLLRDEPPVPNYPSTYQTGMYYLDGQPKPSQEAFHFPLVVDTRDPRHEILWTRVPASGTLVVQRLVGSTWQTLFSLPVSAGQVVERVITNGHARFMASVAGQSSLEWPP